MRPIKTVAQAIQKGGSKTAVVSGEIVSVGNGTADVRLADGTIKRGLPLAGSAHKGQQVVLQYLNGDAIISAHGLAGGVSSGSIAYTASTGDGAPSPHSLDSVHHSGTLAEAQAPWAINTTTFALHTNNASAHHAPVSIGTGGASAKLSITSGQVLTMSSFTSADIADFVEAAQDAVGSALTDTNSIDLVYTDASNAITANVRLDTLSGMSIGSGGLAVGAGTLITVGASTVGMSAGTAQYQIPVTGSTPFTPAYALLSSFAGDGLGFSGGAFIVNAGTLISIISDAVALSNGSAEYQVPFTGGSPLYTPAWSTASANPGAAVRVLRSDGNGYLRLVRLGAGADPLARLHSQDTGGTQLRLAYDGTFYTTMGTDANGDLTITPSGADVYINGELGIGVLPALAPLHVRAAGMTQFQFDYDAATYGTLQVGSNGRIALTATGGWYDITGGLTLSGDLAVNGGDVTATAYLRVTPANGDLTLNPTAGNIMLSPSGDVICAPAGNDVIPNNNYATNLGSPPKQWLSIHAAELHIGTLVAQDVISTIGGNVMVSPTSQLTADIALGDTTILAKHNQMRPGDTIYMKADGKFEALTISTGPTGSGPYTYTVVRNVDGTGATAWYAGDALLNTGTTGSGQVEIYSLESINGLHFDYIFVDDGGIFSAELSDSSAFALFPAIAAANDALYIGMANTTWPNVFFQVAVVGSYTATFAYEYWNGSAWVALTTTGTLPVFTATGGPSLLFIAAQTGWAQTTVNGISAYWIRVRVATVTTWTTTPEQGGRRVRGNKAHWGPTIVGRVRASAVWNDVVEHWALGGLDGMYGYGNNDYGVAFGRYADNSAFLAIDATNGIRFIKRASGANAVTAQWSMLGVITLGDATIEHLVLDSTSLKIYSDSTTVVASLDGPVLNLGQTTLEHIQMDATALQVMDGSIVHINLDGNALTVGRTDSADVEYVTIDSNGLRIRTTGTIYTQLNAGVLTLGSTSTEHVSITSTAVQIKDGSIVYTDLTAGVLTLGLSTAEHTVIDSNGVSLYDDAVLYGRFAATTTIGVTSGDHVSVSSTGLNIKHGATTRIGLTSAGVLTVNDSGGAAVITLDGSAGAEITKKLAMLGASSAIAIGVTGTIPTSSSAGTGIWLDRTGMYGLATNARQVILDATNGKIYAGGGHVILDAHGVTLDTMTSEGAVETGSLNFATGGVTYFRIGSYVTSSAAYSLSIANTDTTNNVHSISIDAYSPNSFPASITVRALGSTSTLLGLDLITSNSVATLYYTGAATTQIIVGNDRISFRAAGAYRARLTTNGLRVGDDTVPSYTLDVSGLAYCKGLGVGAAPSSSIGISSLITASTASGYGAQLIVSAEPTAAQTGLSTYGMLSIATLQTGYNWGVVVGARGDARHNAAAGTITTGIGVYGYVYLQHASGSGVAFSSSYDLYAAGVGRVAGSTATITTHAGVGIMNQGAAYITTSYGLYIAAQSGSATNWPIYSVDTVNPSYFGADIYVRGKIKGIGAQLIDFQVADATTYLDLTGTLQDHPGVTYTATPSVAEYWYVFAECQWNLGAGSGACSTGDPLEGRLIVDGTARSPYMDCIAVGGTGAYGTSHFYKIAMTAGASHTVKIQARNTSGSRGRCTSGTGFVVWRVAQ